MLFTPFPFMKTFLAKKETVQPKWFVIDAEGAVLGRLAVKVANIIRGRNKPTYTPSVDTGDYVIVINAEKVVLTGKKEEQNEYMFFSGFVGGESYRSLQLMRERNPEFIIKHAVKGMLPKNRIANQMLTKLRVFKGSAHTHEAQTPVKISA
jgi:large subunit ribosomal protein L13